MKLYEDFQIHDTLNPDIWDVENKTLLPEVKKKIVEIVSYFEESLEVPIDIVDIQLVGSNASYNYTNTSDLDVHIIANFETVSPQIDLVKAIYDLKKSDFNKNYDVSIHDVPIELYVQDIQSGCTSNGIFSLCENKWIKEPKPINSITKHNIKKESQAWQEHIQKVLSSKDYDKIKDAIDRLYLIRHNSIAKEGEYGKGNELFKEIRSLGLLDKLKKALIEATSDKLTLEQLDENYWKQLKEL